MKQYHVNFEEEDLIGATALASAVYYCKKCAFDFLIQENVIILGKKHPAISAFMPVITTENDIINTIAMLEKLIELGSINEQDEYKYSALHRAIQCNNVTLVSFLLSKKINLFLHNIFNESALSIAYKEYVTTIPSLTNLVNKKKNCFDLLIKAAYEHFYNKAISYTKTEKELHEELNEDVIKLVGKYENSNDSVEFRNKLRLREENLKKYLQEEVLRPALQQAQYDKFKSLQNTSTVVTGEWELVNHIFSFFHHEVPTPEQSCLPSPSGKCYLDRNP